MKIFAGYKPTEKPWGGANNFLRALYKTLEDKHGVEVVYEPSADCDLFFFGQTAKGPANDGDRYTPAEIGSILSINPAAASIMRMVNLRRHTSHEHALTYWLSCADRKIDNDTKAGTRLCDHLIFQSAYQRDNFAKDGVTPAHSTVIHNGAANIFSEYQGGIEKLHHGQKMRIFSSAVSTKGWKQHDVIAAAALNDNIEVFYAGTWPESTPPKNIKLLGRLDHAAIIETARTAHYFLHPSTKEACSNSIIEALAMGLPVLHGKTGSSPETVGRNGMPVDRSGLTEQLKRAAELQPSFVDHLAAERGKYDMAHTAQKYYQTFLDVIRRKAAR